MPRSIQISAPADRSDILVARVRDVAGVVGIVFQRGAAVVPPGDVIGIQCSNEATRPVLEILDELGIHREGTVSTSEPRALISAVAQDRIDRETNETVWDEMAFLLRQDTNLSSTYFGLMAMAGAVAAVGLWTDTLHLVIGAMLIAPGFEPLVRMPFGLITGARELAWRGGIASVAGYLSVLAGAAAAAALLLWTDAGAAPSADTHRWVAYWSTPTGTAVLVSSFGAAAGAMVVTGQRAVLTTGVMVTVALIPSITVVGVAAVVADFALAGDGLLRWLLDVGLVLGVAGLVLWLKKVLLHQGRALS